MTIRTLLARRGRWLRGLWLVAVAIFLGYWIIAMMHGINPRRSIWSLVFVIPLWIGFIARHALLRCPRCRGNLMMLAFGWLKAKSTALRCPYCGLGFDEELTPAKLAESAAPRSAPPLPLNRPAGAGITARMLHRRRNRWIWRTYLAGVIALPACLGLLALIALLAYLGLLPSLIIRLGLGKLLVLLGIAMMGGLAASGSARVAAAIGFECPRCQGRIRLMRFWWLWTSWDTTISCCPYCGLDWDEVLPDEESVDPPK